MKQLLSIMLLCLTLTVALAQTTPKKNTKPKVKTTRTINLLTEVLSIMEFDSLNAMEKLHGLWKEVKKYNRPPYDTLEAYYKVSIKNYPQLLPSSKEIMLYENLAEISGNLLAGLAHTSIQKPLNTDISLSYIVLLSPDNLYATTIISDDDTTNEREYYFTYSNIEWVYEITPDEPRVTEVTLREDLLHWSNVFDLNRLIAADLEHIASIAKQTSYDVQVQLKGYSYYHGAIVVFTTLAFFYSKIYPTLSITRNFALLAALLCCTSV